MMEATGSTSGDGVTLRELHRYAPNVSLLFTELPMLDRPAAAAAAGFDAIEMWWPFEGPEPAPHDARDLVRAVRDAGVQVTSLNLDSGDRAAGARGLLSRPPEIERLLTNVPATVGLAAELGCPVIHAPFGNRLEAISWSEQRRYAVERLAAIAREAATVGATVVVEAQNPTDSPSYPLRTTSQAVDIAVAASELGGAAVRITFDAYHMLQTEGRLAETLRDHLDVIVNVQVAEVPGRGAPRHPASPIVGFVRQLADVGYAGAVGLEYLPSDPSAASFDWLDWPALFDQPRPM